MGHKSTMTCVLVRRGEEESQVKERGKSQVKECREESMRSRSCKSKNQECQKPSWTGRGKERPIPKASEEA